ncbi:MULTISPECIES: tyrosine-type recombinase/integrase [Paraburkholderia]|uniref:tyrosine-type recombinase/integrase n=1 Tax=Paraburkholderia TaxID=1822464 RepID=UPI002258D39C|nr:MULTISPECIES: tyrosine-type recombinase/integrase [Paraburkholderia]MCX4163323.1 tyrosine-type recombinase/integrase [Paraburkholderia megapolitana]MDN7158818.1 site-specific integrase [Paraburkholderia sp. CHISQ3]MDQ6495865.1 site-specific integrase [Paraburkholderia megapolitana]
MSSPTTPNTGHPRPHATDLFDQEREAWRRDPHTAFDTWLASQRLRRSSADVYRAQWGFFLDWLDLRHKHLITVDMPTIAEFVAQLPVRKPQRVRYLRLIERVLDHVRSIELASTNPARFIAQDGEAAWRDARDNEPTGFLNAAERATLIAQLFSPVVTLSSSQRWRERRDRALTALFLGGGLKTGEAAMLSVSCVSAGSPWVTVDAPDPSLTRRTRLSPFAVAILDAWLAERRLSGQTGDLVFPASPAGRPMHKATVLRAVDAQVEASGIAEARAARASPHTLRNTFAADLFESGVAPELVGQWLGFAQAVSANRLHRAWKAWAEKQESVAGGGSEPDPGAPADAPSVKPPA